MIASGLQGPEDRGEGREGSDQTRLGSLPRGDEPPRSLTTDVSRALTDTGARLREERKEDADHANEDRFDS